MKHLTTKQAERRLLKAISKLDMSDHKTLNAAHKALADDYWCRWMEAFDRIAIKAVDDQAAKMKMAKTLCQVDAALRLTRQK